MPTGWYCSNSTEFGSSWSALPAESEAATDHARQQGTRQRQKRLTTFIEAGMVKPSIDRTYPLDRVPEAMRHLEAGAVRGKVVITI